MIQAAGCPYKPQRSENEIVEATVSPADAKEIRLDIAEAAAKWKHKKNFFPLLPTLKSLVKHSIASQIATTISSHELHG